MKSEVPKKLVFLCPVLNALIVLNHTFCHILEAIQIPNCFRAKMTFETYENSSKSLFWIATGPIFRA